MIYFNKLIIKKQLNQKSDFMRKLSQIWFEVQEVLFPFLEKEIEEPLTDKLKSLITTLDLIRIEEMVQVPKYWQGRSPKNRKQICLTLPKEKSDCTTGTPSHFLFISSKCKISYKSEIQQR